MLLRDIEEFHGDPWEYALVRLILWGLIFGATLIDFAWKRTTSIRKHPLYLLILISLVFQMVQNSVQFAISFAVQHQSSSSPPPFLGLFVFNDMTDTINESMELCLIMLVSTGWGVVFTHVLPVHRTILSSGVVILMILEGFLAFANPRSHLYAYWILLWILTNVVIWVYILNMIYVNYKYLSRVARNRPIPRSAFFNDDSFSVITANSSEFVLARVAATARGEQEYHSSPAYLKRVLYRRFAVFVIIYILIQVISHAVLTALLIFDKSFNSSVYWIFTLPRDFLEIFLFACLCYLFRLREDNPYFPLPTHEWETPPTSRVVSFAGSRTPSTRSRPESTVSQRVVSTSSLTIPEEDPTALTPPPPRLSQDSK